MTRLHKFHQLPQLEVELPCTELFGSPSPVYNEELDEECGYVVEGPSRALNSLASDTASSDWEWMQEYGDISYALENCPGVYDRCININEICCKNDRQLTGPTLAELNERRALSPLINPDMKRLHLVATKSENDKLEQFSESNGIKANRSYLAELNRPIPQKLPTPESVVPISQIKNENLPTSLRRVLLYGANRPSALNSVLIPEKSNRKEPIEPRQPKNIVSQDTVQPNEVKVPENVVTEPVHSDAESVGDLSDRESVIADDEDMSSGSEDEEDEDDEATPSKQFGSSRKRKRSEAEDMTPNPKKLFDIGKQLEKLNRVINGLRPMNQTSLNAKNKTRREKNKLASRACRLKKKAGHEANKIKFFGLNQENKRLTDLLHEAKTAFISTQDNVQEQCWLSLEEKITDLLENQVAGRVSEYVDSTLVEMSVGIKVKASPK